MKKLDYAIVLVSDMGRSVAFYRDVLGLPVRFESAQWTECDTGSATLALHLANENSGKPAAPAGAGQCQLGFRVADLEGLHALLMAQNVTCLQKPREERFGKIALYADPDGLAITIMEGA